MTTAAYVPTGPMALLVTLASLGLGCLTLVAVVAAWCALIDRQARKRRERRDTQRPGYLPEKVTRSYREPLRDPWEDWPVLTKGPRR